MTKIKVDKTFDIAWHMTIWRTMADHMNKKMATHIGDKSADCRADKNTVVKMVDKMVDNTVE